MQSKVHKLSLSGPLIDVGNLLVQSSPVCCTNTIMILYTILTNIYRAPIVQSIVSLTADPGVTSRSRPCLILLWRLIMKIISTVILLLPLIQEGLLSVTSESMCTRYWLTA